MLRKFVSELNDLAHKLDPYRLTAIRKYYDGADLVDVFSPSIWSGWYAGAYTNYRETLEENRYKYKRFVHMEYGGSSHLGRHSEQPLMELEGINSSNWEEVANQSHIVNIAKNGDWSENYIVDLFDWYLYTSENLEWFAGNAQWAMKDFGTPLRPENAIPYVNQKGLLDRAGNPKDAYYVFKSYWSEKPFVYLESPSWDIRFGEVGEALEVNVFSNCDSVELFLGGISLGMKQRDKKKYPSQGLHWSVQFKEGDNLVKADAYFKGEKIAENSHNFHYTSQKWGKPDHIQLKEKAIGGNSFLITAIMNDKEDRRVADYEEKVYFDLNGSGRLTDNLGTPTGSSIIAFANGKAQIIIEKYTGEGSVIIEARNQHFKGSYIIIN